MLAFLESVLYLVVRYPLFTNLKSDIMKKTSFNNYFRLKQFAGVTLICCLFIVGLIV
jgi:hypothetical protein